MKKIYALLTLLAIQYALQAQIPEDALRLTWHPTYGTARNQAIGGTIIGLGGEITAAHNNPAGLGFYKNGEMVLSPGFNFGKNKTDYRGTANQSNDKFSSFGLGTSGVIIAGAIDNKKIKSAALSFTINQTANFNSNVYYKGLNNNSSAAERYAEEFSASRLTPQDAIDNKFLSLPTRLALYTYLVDTLTLNGVRQVVAMPEFTNGVMQENRIEQRGGAHELSLGIGANKNEKLFFGASLSMPILNYTRNTTYTETDATPAVTNNGFNNYTYTETLNTSGLGLNAKLGIIYRPVERVRFGATIQSPTYYGLVDKTNGSMAVKIENLAAFPNRTFANTVNYSEQVFTNGAPSIENRYAFITPWKLGIGGSFVFRETENVKKQRAFIAADLEYVTYRTMQYTGIAEEQATANQFKATNSGIKDLYRNTINLKLGGELKLNTVMLRLGGAYYGNPNKDATLKQNIVQLTGGLGYRHKGIFIDAAYVHQMGSFVDSPYRLADKANTFATAKNRTGTVMLTVGTKF